MNPTSLYVSTSRLVFQFEAGDQNLSDLYRLVPYLRQSLSCTVCGRLLIEPYTPQETHCQHHVCRECIGGRKNLKPTCGWCRDYQKYEGNTQLRILLQCYKSLCEYIISTPIYHSMHNQSQTTGLINGTTTNSTSLADLIEEGAQFQDNYKSNSELLKSAYSILPCVYTNNSSTQTLQHNAISLNNTNNVDVKEPPTVSNPPIKTVSNGSAMYSVMYAGTGNKITIKRKTDVEDDFSSSKDVNVSQNFKKPSSWRSKSLQKRKGCRCGNATATPGKLTCCGQRCPCYVESKSCIDCKCRGCRNPHRADGFKIRPHIPQLDCIDLLNNDGTSQSNCLELPMDTFGSSSQENRLQSHQNNQDIPLENDSIIFNPNDLSESDIQVVNVYTTHHLPADVSYTLPSILMQESPTINTSASSPTTTSSQEYHHNPSLHSIFGDDIMGNSSFSEDGCSSDDHSDIDIDI